MKLLIITSCTAKKKIPAVLDMDDIIYGKDHHIKMKAEDLYSGPQHTNLMEGIKTFRELYEGTHTIDLQIVSAGFGIIPGDKEIPSYEVTFNGMSKEDVLKWSKYINIPEDFSRLINSNDFDYAFLLLGKQYMIACNFTSDSYYDNVYAFVSPGSKHLIQSIFRYGTYSNKEAKAIGHPLVSMKGYLMKRFLRGYDFNNTTTHPFEFFNGIGG